MNKKSLREKHGITLIALIITIIIMIILVAVSVSVIINSGLIGKAKKAGEGYKTAYEQEQKIGETINVDGVEYTLDEYIDSIGGDGGTNTTKDKNGLEIAQGENTFPYLPDSNSEITGKENEKNDLSYGLTVKDSNGNEWVWIEVPTSIYGNTEYNSNGDMQPENSEDYVKIRYCLETYAKTLIPEGTTTKNTKNGYKDYWYYYPSNGTVYSKDPVTGDQYMNDTANSDDISSYLTDNDGTKGTGLTYAQYQIKYKAMLKSVYENGGFYIGKYETGTETARGAETDELTLPVIKENAYPYTWITCSQAESLAEGLTTGRKNCKSNVWSTMGFSIKAFKQ